MSESCPFHSHSNSPCRAQESLQGVAAKKQGLNCFPGCQSATCLLLLERAWWRGQVSQHVFTLQLVKREIRRQGLVFFSLFTVETEPRMGLSSTINCGKCQSSTVSLKQVCGVERQLSRTSAGCTGLPTRVPSPEPAVEGED